MPRSTPSPTSRAAAPVCATPSTPASPRTARPVVARCWSTSSSGTATPVCRHGAAIAVDTAATSAATRVAACPSTVKTWPVRWPWMPRCHVPRCCCASPSRSATTPCPATSWTSIHPGPWMPSPRSSSASSRTSVHRASRPPCDWPWCTCCCPPAGSTATPDGWPSCASRQARSARPARANGASAIRGCCSRRAFARCAPSCSAWREQSGPGRTRAWARTSSPCWMARPTWCSARAAPRICCAHPGRFVSALDPRSPIHAPGSASCSPSRPSTGRPTRSASPTSRRPSRWATRPP